MTDVATKAQHHQHHHHHTDEEKEKKRKKALRRMSKILTKAWEIPNAEPFQTFHGKVKNGSTSTIPCLTVLGQKVDNEEYTYGRHGWEDFARDIGGIYNRHIQKKTKHSKRAETHLERICQMLAEKDESLAQVAHTAPPPIVDTTSSASERRASGNKKRRASAADDSEKSHNKRRASSNNAGGGSKKQNSSSRDSISNNNKNLSISEREERALESLSEFISSKGGDPKLVKNYVSRVTKKSSDGRYDIVYFSGQGRRFRSMVEIARHLNLVENTTRSAAGIGMKKRKRSSMSSNKNQASGKQLEAERKKLRKELDRLRKQYSRATKSLDDFLADDKESQYPVEDSLLEEEDKEAQQQRQSQQSSSAVSVLPTDCPAARIPDIRSFCGLPDHCMPDVLQAWDFLCTFSRAISVDPIGLDDFIQCLTYSPPNRVEDNDLWKSPPVYLSEAHQGLLRLILADPSSDEWWWSILETEQTENAVIAADTAVDAVAKEEESDLPLIKVDFAALLTDPEDPLMTTSWLQALQAIRTIKGTDKESMKKALDAGMALVANKWALAYLRKAIKLGKTSGPSFMKRAVVWLLDKVSEAKPELSQRAGSREALKQRAKVVEEVTQQMEKLSSAALTVDEDDLMSDIEEDEDEDESDDEDEPDVREEERKEVPEEASEDDRVASYIPQKPPPSLVDFLLPPGKPIPPTDLLNPVSWPYIAGAAACRIVHRYKRLRNEVDDALRNARELPRLKVKERREREAVSTGRMLTEFVTEDGEDGPTERAYQLLCAGSDYLGLSPLERLALLRVLIEAACDTFRVFEVVDTNYKQRTNAVKALDLEQRKAKRDAKEKAAADDAAARLDLAMEAKNNFLEEKREEIRKLNEANQELTMEEIDTLTEQDILDFDEDIQADFDALPTPESFKKAEVVARVAKIQEAASFETELLTVLTMDELLEREKKALNDMEEYLQELGGEDALSDPGLERTFVRRIEKLRRDIQKGHESTRYLPAMRAEAIETLKEAILDGTMKSLRAAIRTAKTAKLFGPDEETNGVWALDIVRDAHMELENAKHLKRVADAKKDLVSKLNKCFIRTEPLGCDRYRNRFWRFEYSDQAQVWAEVDHVLKESHPELQNKKGFLDVVCDDVSKISIGPADMEEDFPPEADSISKKDFQNFSRREYHQSGATATLVSRHWGCHANELSVRALMKGLDSRGIREDGLKKNLKEALEDKATGVDAAIEKPIDQPEEQKSEEDEEKEDSEEVEKFDTSGDEQEFESVKKEGMSTQSELYKPEMLESLKSSAIGQRVRVRILVEANKEGDIVRYEMGSVTGWKRQKDVVPVQTGEREFEPQTRVVWNPVWRTLTESGTEIWLSGKELIESIGRSIRWEQKDPTYFEDDASFLAYRNNLGRYCGKAADAPHAMSPIRFGQYMVKREAELYQRLKVLALDNNWGGKSGSRNAWVTSMKDYAFDFQTVREGLLALEDAFFELIGGETKDENGGAIPSGKEILDNPSTREDIELESIDANVSGLWNSPASRSVFREIVSKSETVGFLSLAFELLWRNTRAFIDAQGVKSGAGAAMSALQDTAGGYEQYAPLPMRTTRRMNAWQQQQQASDNQAYWDVPVRQTRRMNAWQQANGDWD